MGRPPRIQFEGALYHLTTRGNDRDLIFLHDYDREIFLSILSDVVGCEAWICHAYCLMPNHYHLLVQTPDANLAHGMHALNMRYAKGFLTRHGRTGHLFERRYEDVLVERQEHLLEVARYVVLNPVRAKRIECERAEDWRWSSYRATAGLAPGPRFLTTDWVLAQFGPPAIRRQRYRDFVAEGSPATTLKALLL